MSQNEAVSQPLQDSVQAGQVDEAFKQFRVVFPACDQAMKPLQPTDRAFDFVAAFVSPQGATVLQRRLRAVLSVRADQLDASFGQRLTQPVGIGGLVVKKPLRPVSRAAMTLVHQRFDGVNFAHVGGGDECRKRQVIAVGQHKDVAAVPFATATDVLAPFFARTNEPSPIASSQSMPRRCINSPSSRSHAARNTPERVQSRCLLQQVQGEGYRSGKSFHRAPVNSTHRTPSRHSRGGTQGRPPCGPTGGSGNRSAIRSHWESERYGLGAVLDPVQFRRRRGGQCNRVMSMGILLGESNLSSRSKPLANLYTI